MMETVIFRDLGNMGYKEAWEYQEELLQKAVRLKTEWRQGQDAGVRGAGAGLANAAGEGERGTEAVGETRAGQAARRERPAGEAGTLQAGEEGNVKTGERETDGYNGPDTKHYLLFVEHPPVYTIGKSGHMENLLLDEAVLAARGVELFRTNRGGDITFHGPEQLVGYPVLDLERFYTDIGKYLRNLEEVIILVLEGYGIKGERSAGETGVWIEPGIKGRERKICAIGVRCSRWVTMHGFAFNVNTDLNYFNDIVPCGIVDKQVTSLERELGYRVPMEEARERVRLAFGEVFGVKMA